MDKIPRKKNNKKQIKRENLKLNNKKEKKNTSLKPLRRVRETTTSARDKRSPTKKLWSFKCSFKIDNAFLTSSLADSVATWLFGIYPKMG